MPNSDGVPRSVGALNRHPYSFGKFRLGTVLYQLVTAAREFHADMTTSGAILTLVNELRTKLNTAGDAFTLINAIRGELISGGQLAERLLDLEDKAYNQILTDPGMQEDAGVNTDIENANQIDGIVNGVFVANIIAAGALNMTPAAGWATGVLETRLVTLATTAGGVASATVSAVGATIPPRPPSGEMPFAVVNIPASFNPGVTQIAAGGVTFTDGFPRRLAVHTPIATAAVGAVAASALAAITADSPAELPDIDG